MTRSRQKTRERILRAARDQVLTEGLPEAIDIRLADVLKSLGLTPGAAYQVWDSQDEFRLDVALSLVRDFEWATAPEIAPDDIDTKAQDFARAASDFASRYFEHFVSRPDFFVAMHFWSVADPTPELVESVRAGYRIVHESFVDLYQAFLDAYHRELTSPYELDELATMITAQVEGLALRQRFEPDSVTFDQRSVLTTFIEQVMVSFTQPKSSSA